MEQPVIDWLLSGDVSIQYQVRRDLLGEDPASAAMQKLRRRISTEGWGSKFLAARGEHAHWGLAFYQPKWTSSNYTLLDLRNLEMERDQSVVRKCIHRIALEDKGADGGINPSGSVSKSDVCIAGMYLNYASYFGEAEESLVSVVDFVLGQHMPDGGFNCRLNRSGARHSSMHTTMMALEGFLEYERWGYTYRLDEVRAAADAAREFLLQHRLYKSDRTGEVIRDEFLRLAYPPRWKYNVLRALDHFRAAGVPWDERMRDALEVVVSKQRADGRWPLQAAWPGKVHFRMEESRGPSRWNTLLALRVLGAYGRNDAEHRVHRDES